MTEQHLRPGPAKDPTPAEDVSASAEWEVDGNPWEHREALGWWRALAASIWLFLRHPIAAYEGTAARGGYRGPLLFAFLVCFVAGFVSELFDALYQLAVDPQGSGNLGDIFDVQIENERLRGIEWLPASLLGAASFAGCVIGLLVGIPVFAIVFPLFMLLWTGILHLCLKMVGGLRESAAGYQGTWAAVCYATVAFVPGGIPVVGEWITFFWLGLAQGIGFWRLHRTDRWRAALALLLPFSVPLVLWLLKVAGVLPIEGGGP